MQRQLTLIGITGKPRDETDATVAQVKDAAQAIRISLIRCHAKQGWVAMMLKISGAYLSQLKKGKNVPDWFVRPFCEVTGTNLLDQFLILQQCQKEAHKKLTQREQDLKLARQIMENAA